MIPESYLDLIRPGISFPFRPGMTASADIQTRTKNYVTAISLNAVTTRDQDGAKQEKQQGNDSEENTAPAPTASTEVINEVVFLLQKDNKVKMVKVKTGIQDLNYIEILEGLKGGEEVVTGPYSVVSKLLKDGNLVTVVSKDKLFEEKKKE